MGTTYVTFGQSHMHRIGDKLFNADCVAAIPAPTAEEGRALAFEYFGRKWCFEHFNTLPEMRYFPAGIVPINHEEDRLEYTLKQVKEAYEDAYYEAAGKDAWYRDHNNEQSTLDEDSHCYRKMQEFIKTLKKKES